MDVLYVSEYLQSLHITLVYKKSVLTQKKLHTLILKFD